MKAFQDFEVPSLSRDLGDPTTLSCSFLAKLERQYGQFQAEN
jgi:hypothetical protein